jgi:hypothetical protein
MTQAYQLGDLGQYLTVDTTGNNISLSANSLSVGNSVTNVVINSTSFTGSANNTSYVGTVSAANVVSNTQLSSNLANYAALAGATFTGAVSVTNNFTVTGNLTVTGTTFSANVTNLDVKDLNITVAKGAASAAATDGAGLTVDTAGIGWYYNYASNTWQSNVGITPSANVTYDLGSNPYRWSNVYANNFVGINIYGTLQTASQPNITANNSTNFNGQSYSTVTGFITSNAATAYTNATSYADTKAATAYSNAIAYSGNAALAYANAIAYSGNAALAYSNAVSYVDTKIGTANTAITGNAATAYTNAVAAIASSTANNANHVIYANYRTVVATPNTVLANDSLIFVNMSTNSTINLPAASATNGSIIKIKNINTGYVSIIPNGSDTIDGQANLVIQYQYSAAGLISTSTGWAIV